MHYLLSLKSNTLIYHSDEGFKDDLENNTLQFEKEHKIVYKFE